MAKEDKQGNLHSDKNGQFVSKGAADVARKYEKYTPSEEIDHKAKSRKEGETAEVKATDSFASQVDAVLSGADTTATHLQVTHTPPVLRALNIPDLPIIMTAKHVKSVALDSGKDSVNYHGLGAETVKRLPELLADPVMIMRSMTKDDSVVVLTAALDKENRPIIAAVKLSGRGVVNGERIEANILTSIYGKDNFPSFLHRNVDSNTVMWWSDKKARETHLPALRTMFNTKGLPPNKVLKKF